MSEVTARLFRLVDLLQSNGKLTIGQLSERLGVSERTIRRDIVRLQDIDLPIDVELGRLGGVRVKQGALLPPMRFTDDELLAVVLGTKQLGRFGERIGNAAARALKRLETAMSEETRARVESLTEAVSGETAPYTLEERTESQRVFEFASYVRACNRLEVVHTSPHRGASRRMIDPYGLVRLGRWYLAAYCHLRQDVRTFRLDRINQIRITGAVFKRPDEFDAFAAVVASLANAPSHGKVICKAVLFANLEEVSQLVPTRVVVLEPERRGVLLSVRVRPDEIPTIALHLLSLPCKVEVLGPTELHQALESIAERARSLANA